MTGTSGADVFNGIQYTDSAANSTYVTADAINGGAGADVLNVVVQKQDGTATGAASLAVGNVTGVETINIRSLSATATDVLSVDASNFAGLTAVNADRAINAVTVTNLAAGASAGITGNGAVTNAALNFGYATASAAATLNIANGTKAGNVAITSTPAAVTVNSNGAANTIGTVALGGSATALTVNATSGLTTGNITGFTGTSAAITVTGAGAVSLGTLEASTVKTVNASGLTGGLTLTANSNTSLSVVGSSGNDRITVGTALVLGSIDAGAGSDDRLTVTANSVVNNATNAGKFTNFEVIQANAGVTDVDMSLFTGMTGIRVNDGAGSVTVSNITAAQATNVAITATDFGPNTSITLALKDATNGGQIDTVKATLSTTTGTTTLAAQNIDLRNITLAGVEKLELVANGTAASTSGTVSIDLANATAVDTFKFSGVGAGNMLDVGASLAANLNVDASGSTGSVSINAAAYNTTTGATLTGGSGADTIFGSAKVDTIVGGAGNDNIYGDAATLTAEVQTITLANNVTTAGSINIGGVAVAIADGATPTTAASAVVTAKSAVMAANQNIANITSAGGVITVTYKATAGDVSNITATYTTATNQTATVTEATTGAFAIGGHAAADVLTGGDGNDTFFFKPVVTTNTLTNMARITDLNLGTSAVSGQVDKLTLDLATAGSTTAPVIVALTDVQKATVAAAATLSAAVDAVLGIAGTVNNAVQFTYGTDTYLIVNGATLNAGYTDSEDIIVKITGVTGTLDASDLNII